MICHEMYKLQQQRKMKMWTEAIASIFTLILAII